MSISLIKYIVIYASSILQVIFNTIPINKSRSFLSWVWRRSLFIKTGSWYLIMNSNMSWAIISWLTLAIISSFAVRSSKIVAAGYRMFMFGTIRTDSWDWLLLVWKHLLTINITSEILELMRTIPSFEMEQNSKHLIKSSRSVSSMNLSKFANNSPKTPLLR